MPIFLLFVRAGVLFDGAFSVQVSLNALILFCQFFIHKKKSRFLSISSYDMKGRCIHSFHCFTRRSFITKSENTLGCNEIAENYLVI